jgi:hypothetical protein
MTASERIYYAVQEAVWAGWSLHRIKQEILESYKEVLREQLRHADAEMAEK